MDLKDIRKIEDTDEGIKEKLKQFVQHLRQAADEKKLPVAEVFTLALETLQYNILSTEMIGFEADVDARLRRAHAASELDILTLSLRAISGRVKTQEELNMQQYLLDELHQANELYRKNLT